MDLQLFSEEKREQPTQKRRQDARKRGQVPKSQDISVLVTLLAGMMAIRAFGPSIVTRAQAMAINVWTMQVGELTIRSLGNIMVSVTQDGFMMVLPIMAIIAICGVSSEVAQVGFMVTGESIAFKISRINPFEGFQRLFSKRSLVEFFKALFKVSVVGLCLWQVIRDAFIKMPELIAMSLPQAVAWGGSIVWQMIIRCSFGLCVIAVADYAFQWWENERSLMMSRKELTEELKETEGRPEIKQRIRQRQRQIATGRMMANVKKADVVVANPDHFAVALKYEAGAMMAPVVLAKGAGWLAQRIKEEARAHRVTIIENPPVARALHASVEVGEPVPPSLYQAVAEILAFVYSLKTKAQRPVLEEVEE